MLISVLGPPVAHLSPGVFWVSRRRGSLGEGTWKDRSSTWLWFDGQVEPRRLRMRRIGLARMSVDARRPLVLLRWLSRFTAHVAITFTCSSLPASQKPVLRLRLASLQDRRLFPRSAWLASLSPRPSSVSSFPWPPLSISCPCLPRSHVSPPTARVRTCSRRAGVSNHHPGRRHNRSNFKKIFFRLEKIPKFSSQVNWRKRRVHTAKITKRDEQQRKPRQHR